MSKSMCKISECVKAARCRGMCSMHYERWRKHGSPYVVLPPSSPPVIHTQSAHCEVDGCDAAPLARNLCPKHYRAWRRNGDPTADRRRRVNICEVDGCERPCHGHGFCFKHYQRWSTHGSATYEAPHHTRCIVQDCDNEPRSLRSGLCDRHYSRRWRHGSVDAVIDTRRDDAGYRAAHGRITKDRGRARTYRCIDCGRRADHWSYRHDDPDELVSPTGQPYSLDPTHYDPRCAPCHAIFDGTGANQYGKKAVAVKAA